jgi:flagellar motor switch protein FliM
MQPPGSSFDPFAVDFFGGEPLHRNDREASAENEPPTAKRGASRKKSDWHKNLPRVAAREAEFSNLLTNLPENLTESAARIIAQTLARYISQSPENVRCEVVSVTEVNLNRAVQQQNEAPKILLTIGSQPENARAIAAVNVDLASSLIDSMLDGQDAATADKRDLSPIETTIVEFLAAGILGEINNFLGEKLLILQNAKTAAADFFEPFERGAEIVFSVESGETRGFISLYAPQRFLKSLDKTENPLFAKKTGARKLSDFERFARELPLRLQIGATGLAAESLLYLERDDIVLIEKPLIALESENFGGDLRVYVGRGVNFRLRGPAANDDAGDGLQFRIEEILSEEARRKFTPARLKMDVNENDLAEEKTFENDSPGAENAEENAEDEQIAPSLENIQVALRVEIAGDKISLRELQNLRAGQIIALGVGPNDPVRLVTDNAEEPIAAGELVEIEGQLGVRLTKIFI